MGFRLQQKIEHLEPRTLLSTLPPNIELVKDLDPATLSSEMSAPVAANGLTFFAATSVPHGRELWVTDGTPVGTRLVHDIAPGANWSMDSSVELFSTPTAVLFEANDGSGDKLWRSDGTSVGTYPFWQGVANPLTLQLNWNQPAVIRNGLRYLPCTYSGGEGIATTDGTPGGTQLLVQTPSLPQSVSMTADGTLYFGCDDDVTGWELWRSDGTASGTHLLVDLKPGFASSSPYAITAVGNRIFFKTEQQGTGIDGLLWTSDGTVSGTYQPRMPNNQHFDTVWGMAALGNKLVFSTFHQIWTNDGSVTGSTLVRTFGTGSERVWSFRGLNDRAYYYYSSQFWITDGTAVGTAVLASPQGPIFNVSGLPSIVGDRVYFAGEQSGTGRELFSTDGTVAGTMRIDIYPGAASSSPGRLESDLPGPLLIFSANNADPVAAEPFVTDGTAAGTRRLADINIRTNHANPTMLTRLGNEVIFYASAANQPTRGIWKTNGTAAGTSFLGAWTMAGEGASFGPRTVVIGDRLYFVGSSLTLSPNNYQLLRTDGTPAGTRAVNTIGSNLSPQWLTVIGNDLYFAGTVGSSMNLYRYTHNDGANIQLLVQGISATVPIAAYGNSIYFISGPDVARIGAGETNPIPVCSSANVRRLSSIAGRFIVTTNVSFNTYMHLSDGISSNLEQFFHYPGHNSTPYQLRELNDGVVFSLSTVGTFVTDFQPGGTTLLTTARSSEAGEWKPIRYQGVDYFSGSGAPGLLRTDGTVAGTWLVAAVQARYLTVVDGRIYFQGYTSATNYELWESDGTPAGTRMVTDFPGGNGFQAEYPVAMGSTLLVSGNDYDVHGYEVYRVNPDTIAPDIEGYGLNATAPAGTTLNFTFNESVRVSHDGAPAQLIDAVTGAVVAGATPQLSAAGNTLSVTFTGMPNGHLPAGYYRLHLPADAVEDLAGHPLDIAATFPFVLAGKGETATIPAGFGAVVARAMSLIGTGTIDLNDNALVLDYEEASPMPSVQASISAARNGGTWTGPGLTSSAARHATPKNRTLGLLESAEFKSIYGDAALFAGEAIDATAVLVKYTYYGDADFNGQVNFDDYSRTDAGFNFGRTGWLNGDFDGNGVINFDDYSLIDLAFNTQSGGL